MTVIAITGPTGAGKGIASGVFKSRGIPVLDLDNIYHEILVPGSACVKELAGSFGEKILRADGTVDRTVLSSLVYGHPEQLKKLNLITHTHIREEVKRRVLRLSDEGTPCVVLDAPTLFDSPLSWPVDRVISVIADENIRHERIKARDHLTDDEALRRIRAQHGPDFYASRSDLTFVNDGNDKQSASEAFRQSLVRALDAWHMSHLAEVFR